MKLLIKIILGLVFPILLYIAISALLMLFPANLQQGDNKSNQLTKNGIISLTHDLAHVNILIDLSKSSIAWDTLIPELVPAMNGYLLVGWGDLETYQSTPNWSDLKASVALKALFTNTTSALHIRYLPSISHFRMEVTPLHINKTISNTIEQKIVETFQSSIPKILALGYDTNDRFYYSIGTYNVFNTCNTWVGDVLRQSGVAVSRWTPFSYNVIHSIPEQLRKKI